MDRNMIDKHTLDARLNGKSFNLRQDFDLVKEKASETKDAIAQTAWHAKHNARKILNSSLEEAKHHASDIQQKTRSYVKEHPVKSVGIALAAGWVIAKLLRR